MLKKLLKYEYRATYKLYLILYLIVLALAGVIRLLTSLNFDNIILNVTIGMFTVTIVLSCIGLYFATLIFTLYRFYKNLFTDEGYLMFTLPVTPMKLIVSKIIVGMTWVLSSILIIITAAVIMLIGTDTMDTLKYIWNIFGSGLYEMLFDGKIWQVILYGINYFIGIFSTVCFIYLAVAFGQLMMPRHKVGGSILAYFIISICSGILSTVVTLLYYAIAGIDFDSTYLPNSYYGVTSILTLALSLVSIYLINNICKKHLNLS